MKIRWKLMILLLGAALLPLIITRVTTVLSIRSFGGAITEDAKEYLIRHAQQELRQVITYHAAKTGREGQLIQTLLDLQRNQILNLLWEIPPDQSPHFYTSLDFDHPATAPPGLVSSMKYGTYDKGGQITAKQVNFNYPVLYFPPGISRDDISQDLSKLTDIGDIYKDLYTRFSDAILWQYTALENGLFISYPGKGGYPKDFDPRKRSWYTQTKKKGKSAWQLPLRDLTTQQEAMTCSTPLYDRNGKFIGVTAIDVSFERMLGKAFITTDWADAVEVMYIHMAGPEELDQLNLPRQGNLSVPLMFMKGQTKNHNQPWTKSEHYQQLQSDDVTCTNQLLEMMNSQSTGILQMPINGKNMICAFGSMNPGEGLSKNFMVLVVPYDRVLANANKAEKFATDSIWALLRDTAIVLLIVMAVTVLIAWIASNRITKPVIDLAETAQRVADGQLDAQVIVCETGDELCTMSHAFNDMMPKLRDRMRMRESLNLAMEVQQSLLPSGPPKFDRLDIAGHSIYCDETGGDYYDFLEFEDLGARTIGVAIGDVTGHGIAAALLMATARALLRSCASISDSLENLFNNINRELAGSKFQGRFMTLFYMVIDEENEQFTWLSAGHDPALIYDPSTDSFDQMAGSDIPLGIDANWKFNQFQRKEWPSGKIIVLGTDGIWECHNGSGSMFGKDRLQEIIQQHHEKPAEQITNAINEAVHQFRGDYHQEDDITMVVIKVL